MPSDTLFLLNEWVIFLMLIGLLEGATLLGIRLGRRESLKSTAPAHSEIGTVLGGMLGLLGLLLGFTFAMASDRFNERKLLVVDEANALGTAALRARMLPEPAQGNVSELVKAYVLADIDFYDAGVSSSALSTVEARIARLQEALWLETVGVAALSPQSHVVGLFVQSINNVIDLHTKRTTAMQNHVPHTVMVVLIVVAAMGVGILGFASGLGPSRDQIPALLAALSIVIVVMLIVDLSRPRRGLITSGQQSILLLRDTLAANHLKAP